MLNQNEKYLLKFISRENEDKTNERKLLEVVLNMGIDIKIKDFNPIYQIIDELEFLSYKAKLIRK